ncbi:MAG TPA: L-serine ammonia-lyase, iron-sulfur-dependent, subunit alpha [Bacillota bacterium]|nr:L-serine ammonia-lyase, iron-sulfur-dependent, subunit alpha [Bacillota bacterium]
MKLYPRHFSTVVHNCNISGIPLSRYFLDIEIVLNECTEEEIIRKMENNLRVMENAAAGGMAGVRSFSGLTGGDAARLDAYRAKGSPFGGSLYLEAMINALAVNEVNASMGVICATPTAGSSGILPGVLLAIRNRLNLSRRAQLDFLITAGGAGILIGNQASLSGAEGGCQAEVGSASAMTAAAIVEAAGGTPAQSGHALAIALKNILGLTCDPVASLVEVPCIKRNAIGVVNAIAAAEMALAGIESRIPADEVIQAMGSIGRMMPMALRETALGGLAQTPTARRMTKMLKEEGHILWPFPASGGDD